MEVYINEKPVQLTPGTSLFDVRDDQKPQADILIVNSFVVKDNQALKDGDRVSLIARGEVPSQAELEGLMASRHTVGVHEKVKGATVAVAGLGGLGSTCAVSLARIGVGKLILVDYDVVEPSNLNRQQYFIRHIGMKKTDALQELLQEINPFIEVETVHAYLDADNMIPLLGDADLVVEAFDNPAAKATLLATWRKAFPKKPIVTGSGMAGSYSSNTVKTREILPGAYMVGDGEQEARQGCGLMAPRVGVAANHQANMVLRLILGETEA